MLFCSYTVGMEPRKKAPRDVVVRFRCTVQDKAELEKAASELGEDLSGWARRVLLATARKLRD